jgi:hypothetical protein
MVQMQERFPEGEMDLSSLFHVFDVDLYVHLKHDQLGTFGEQEVTAILEMLNQKNDGTKKFFCRIPFIDLAAGAQGEVINKV